jgi:hypothetical protein
MYTIRSSKGSQPELFSALSIKAQDVDLALALIVCDSVAKFCKSGKAADKICTYKSKKLHKMGNSKEVNKKGLIKKDNMVSIKILASTRQVLFQRNRSIKLQILSTVFLFQHTKLYCLCAVHTVGYATYVVMQSWDF